MTEPGADLTKFTFFVQEEVPRTAEGPQVTLLLRRARATPGRLDSPASRRGHEYSQTCAYKEDIKICTVASFQCVWKLPKVTNLNCAKNSFVKKSEKKKSLPWQQCIRSPSETSRHVCLARTYPEQMENETMRVRAKDAAVFYGKSQAQADASHTSHSIYIYKYMYMYL